MSNRKRFDDFKRFYIKLYSDNSLCFPSLIRLEHLPEEISGLVNLTDLHLSQNMLETIPDGICKLTKLTILKLDQNRLHTLNDAIGACVNMQELILTENFLMRLPNSIGNMTKLNNLNVDRNALLDLPPEIGNCVSLGVLSLRDNKLTKIPAEMGNCAILHVLDVSGNRLNHLPYSLVNLQLKAVWLSENQAQPLLTFQPDVDEESGEQVLTCFLLPQLDYQVAADDKILLRQQQERDGDSDSDGWEEREASRTVSVKFTDDSQMDKDTPFVRQNTPHPKELKMKAQKLFGKGKAGEENNLDALSEESSSRPSLQRGITTESGTFAMDDQLAQKQATRPPSISDSTTSNNNLQQTNGDQHQSHETTAPVHENGKAATNEQNGGAGGKEPQPHQAEEDEDNEHRVGFEDDPYGLADEDDVKRPVRLQRRDTPHHLKNKRVQHGVTDKAAHLIIENAIKRGNTPLLENSQTIGIPVVPEVEVAAVHTLPESVPEGVEDAAELEERVNNDDCKWKYIFGYTGVIREWSQMVNRQDVLIGLYQGQSWILFVNIRG